MQSQAAADAFHGCVFAFPASKVQFLHSSDVFLQTCACQVHGCQIFWPGETAVQTGVEYLVQPGTLWCLQSDICGDSCGCLQLSLGQGLLGCLEAGSTDKV